MRKLITDWLLITDEESAALFWSDFYAFIAGIVAIIAITGATWAMSPASIGWIR